MCPASGTWHRTAAWGEHCNPYIFTTFSGFNSDHSQFLFKQTALSHRWKGLIVPLWRLSDLSALGSLQYRKQPSVWHLQLLFMAENLCLGVQIYRLSKCMLEQFERLSSPAAHPFSLQRLLLLQQRQLKGWQVVCSVHDLGHWFQLTLLTGCAMSSGSRMPWLIIPAGHSCSS